MASTQQDTPELGSLASEYNIIGGLRSHGATERLLARRRTDGQDVVITIARTLADADNNSLAHLATDAQLLRTLSHPNISKVLEGRWIGADAFATVTERYHGDTVQELLDRGTRFANTRAAILLEDVQAALAWAREQGVIHRGVHTDEMVFDRSTNRLIFTLTRTPIPINGVPDATSDARTIGRLAWTLLSGEPWTAEGDKSLAELCPNLASRVVDDTTAMASLKEDAVTPDVDAYIGVVAAGDVLKRAEVDLVALKDEVTEWRDTEYRKFDRRKRELEEKARVAAAALAKEREEFKRFMSDERAAVAAERAEFESNVVRRQKRLAEVRDELEEQRSILEQRLAELDVKRLELERAQREVLEAGRAVAAGMPLSPRILSPVERVVAVAAGPARKENRSSETMDWRDYVHWLMPSISVALLLLIIALGIGMARHARRAPNVVRVGGSRIIAEPPPPLDSTPPPRGGFLSQSAPGSVGPVQGSGKTGAPLATPRSSVPPDTSATDTTDAAFKRDSAAAAQSRGDSAAEARRRAARRSALQRDSLARRDTTTKPDTARPDTLNGDRRVPRADTPGSPYRP